MWYVMVKYVLISKKYVDKRDYARDIKTSREIYDISLIKN